MIAEEKNKIEQKVLDRKHELEHYKHQLKNNQLIQEKLEELYKASNHLLEVYGSLQHLKLEFLKLQLKYQEQLMPQLGPQFQETLLSEEELHKGEQLLENWGLTVEEKRVMHGEQILVLRLQGENHRDILSEHLKELKELEDVGKEHLEILEYSEKISSLELDVQETAPVKNKLEYWRQQYQKKLDLLEKKHTEHALLRDDYITERAPGYQYILENGILRNLRMNMTNFFDPSNYYSTKLRLFNSKCTTDPFP